MRLAASSFSGLVAVLLALLTGRDIEAHKPITSKYTYSKDVFPIFRDRCGGCHAPSGAAPMSLLDYKGAVPWAESIREELTARRMPPWSVGSTTPVLGRNQLVSAIELDTIVTWAAGGTPEGDQGHQAAPIDRRDDWPAGKPDLVVPMEAEHVLLGEVREETWTFTLNPGLAETRWVKAADLLPGMRSMVRDATISVENGPVLAVWEPGDEPIWAPHGAGFRLEAGARLQVRIHYKKSWRDEHAVRSDRSAVGLYWTDSTAHELKAVQVDGKAGCEVSTPTVVVAVRPALDRLYTRWSIQARPPSGPPLVLLDLSAPSPEWPRRYWLAHPVELPAGSRLEVVIGDPLPEPDGQSSPFRPILGAAVDFTAQ